jgi:hypothetical protein
MYEFRREYFVGWGTLALLNAGLAQSKGKSGLLWGLLSLFLGPFATLLLVTVYASNKA